MSNPPLIGLIVTGTETLNDYKIFVASLEQWHPNAVLYVYTDSATNIASVKTKCTVHTTSVLNSYTGLNRQKMEQLKGKVYSTLWTDFMYEKANVIQWIFDVNPAATTQGVWFMDADITHLAPLPTIPQNATLALCPHYIRDVDHARFGKYNGGYIWFGNPNILKDWKAAGQTSRFFEQAALEDLTESNTVYEFPIQVNYGWWRMFQSPIPPQQHASLFTLFRPDKSIGIRYDGQPLQSVHTHWYQIDNTATGFFNKFFLDFLNKFKMHKPFAQLRSILTQKPIS
jgi:hypothetical protein